MEGVPAAGVVDVAGVVPQTAASCRRLAAGGRDQEGQVRGLPAAGPPVLVGLTPATLQLRTEGIKEEEQKQFSNLQLNIVRSEGLVVVHTVGGDEVVGEGHLEVLQQLVLVHVGQEPDDTGGDEDHHQQDGVAGQEVPALEGHCRVAEERDEDGDGPGGDDQPDGDLVDHPRHHQHHLPPLKDGPEAQTEDNTPAELGGKRLVRESLGVGSHQEDEVVQAERVLQADR